MFKLLLGIFVGVFGFVASAMAADMPVIENYEFGVVNASSKFTPAVVMELFPDYAVKMETYFAEGDEYVKMVVMDADQKIAEFTENGEGGFWDAYVFSALIADENGIHVGMLASELPQEILLDCFAAAEANADKLICSIKASGNIQYWIDGNDMASNAPKITAGSKIYAIRWLVE